MSLDFISRKALSLRGRRKKRSSSKLIRGKLMFLKHVNSRTQKQITKLQPMELGGRISATCKDIQISTGAADSRARTSTSQKKMIGQQQRCRLTNGDRPTLQSVREVLSDSQRCAQQVNTVVSFIWKNLTILCAVLRILQFFFAPKILNEITEMPLDRLLSSILLPLLPAKYYNDGIITAILLKIPHLLNNIAPLVDGDIPDLSFSSSSTSFNTTVTSFVQISDVLRAFKSFF